MVSNMGKTETALNYFDEKFHCSQAVLAAYASELGLTEEQALKIASCFGSGFRKGGICGACSGALMVLGLKYGQAKKEDLESRIKTNEMSDAFLEKFAEENGSYNCNDLLGCDIATQEGIDYALEKKLFTEFCPKMVESAMKILEEL